MRYSTIVEQDDSALMEIINALNQFEQERFIAAIQAGNCKPYDIQQTLDLVRLYQLRMNVEARALLKFSETFIGQFATDNNHCFKTAENYFNRISKTLSGLKKVFRKTCPTSRKQLPAGVSNPSVFDRSPLSYGEHERDVFGLGSYDSAVQELYQNLETLFTTATNILGLCHQMIEREEDIRQDTEQLRAIYRKSCDSLMVSVKEVSKFMTDTEVVSGREMMRRKAKARSMDDFLQREYHNVSKSVFKKYVWLEATSLGQDEGLTKEEVFLWPDHHEKVFEVRHVIALFDRLDHVEGQEGKFNSGIIVEFLKWCGVDRPKEKRLYKYFCDNYKGQYKPLVWSSISKERKELLEISHLTDQQLAGSFKRRLSLLSETKADEIPIIPKVANN